MSSEQRDQRRRPALPAVRATLPPDQCRTRDANGEVRRDLCLTACPPAGPQPCLYLKGRQAVETRFRAEYLRRGVHRRLLDLNYKRWGHGFARPACQACTACRAIRIPVALFTPSRAQRRCVARNRDVVITIGAPILTPEKQVLYSRYLRTRHDGKMSGSPAEFRTLFESPIHTVELVYRLEGRVIAASIVDVEPDVLSALYCYFDPELGPRSLGVLNLLAMIALCRRWGLAYLYLGYWVREYPKTRYMLAYRPFQLLARSGVWWTFRGASDIVVP